MAYRLKNSDFKPFFGIFDEKVSDLWVYVREGIGVYFVVFSSGESVPGMEVVTEYLDGIDRRNGKGWDDGRWDDFCGKYCGNYRAICIGI